METVIFLLLSMVMIQGNSPPNLKNTDNSEIKIIIQHQFWDLKTSEDHFEVTLSLVVKKEYFCSF